MHSCAGKVLALCFTPSNGSSLAPDGLSGSQGKFLVQINSINLLAKRPPNLSIHRVPYIFAVVAKVEGAGGRYWHDAVSISHRNAREIDSYMSLTADHLMRSRQRYAIATRHLECIL